MLLTVNIVQLRNKYLQTVSIFTNYWQNVTSLPIVFQLKLTMAK